MKKWLFVALIFFSGCTSVDISGGSDIYQNFCGNGNFVLLKEKGSRMYALLSDPEVVIAVRDKVTGSMVMVGSAGDYTLNYLPEEIEGDEYLIFMDKRALENEKDYCQYAVALNKRTNEFLVINATELQSLE